MDDQIDLIKKLAIISLFTDDELMETFALKGGNALNVIHQINDRASRDIDVSMALNFEEGEIEDIKNRLERSFKMIFADEKYVVFDFDLIPTPKKVREELQGFWGGYTILFKVISQSKYNALKNEDHQALQRNAIVIGENQEKKFEIDISAYEYIEPKVKTKLGGYTIYVYSPLMVMYEKLRAICQQMEQYREIVVTNRKQRPRDFFDIYSIVSRFPDKNVIFQSDNLRMLIEIFNIKKVPLSFLRDLEIDREYHREAFQSVQASVSTEAVQPYDFYFDFVVTLVEEIFAAFERLDGAEQIAIGYQV